MVIHKRKERMITHSSRVHALDVAKELRLATGHRTRVSKKDGRYKIFEYWE